MRHPVQRFDEYAGDAARQRRIQIRRIVLRRSGIQSAFAPSRRVVLQTGLGTQGLYIANTTSLCCLSCVKQDSQIIPMALLFLLLLLLLILFTHFILVILIPILLILLLLIILLIIFALICLLSRIFFSYLLFLMTKLKHSWQN
jgi:hypothetical protein